MNGDRNKVVEEVITVPKNLDRPKDWTQTKSFKMNPSKPAPALSFVLKKDPSKKALGALTTTNEFYEIANSKSRENNMPIQQKQK